jgi:dTDP-glucose pyrophosphorylase
LGFYLAFFAEFTALLGDTGFGYAILCCDAFVSSPFFLVEADNLLFKFGGVIL